MEAINQADTAWLMMSCALVMLMTPGLALFYGGMVGERNVLSSFMHSFIAPVIGRRNRPGPPHNLTLTLGYHMGGAGALTE
jgi:ammonia channel protein AmtB